MEVFEVSRPTILRDYLKVLSTVIEEPTLRFSPEGLTVLEMDPSHVSMVDFFLPMEYFDRWRVTENFDIAMSLPDVLKVLKKMNKSDSYLSFEYALEDVTITLKSDIQRKKIIKTLEVIDHEVPKPKLYPKSKTRMIFDVFRRILDDFNGSGPRWKIKTDSEQIVFSVNGELAKEITPISRHNDNILEHWVEEESQATFTHENIFKFVKLAVKVAEVVCLTFSDDMPLTLDVELPQGKMIYYLAPCIGV